MHQTNELLTHDEDPYFECMYEDDGIDNVIFCSCFFKNTRQQRNTL